MCRQQKSNCDDCAAGKKYTGQTNKEHQLNENLAGRTFYIMYVTKSAFNQHRQ